MATPVQLVAKSGNDRTVNNSLSSSMTTVDRNRVLERPTHPVERIIIAPSDDWIEGVSLVPDPADED